MFDQIKLGREFFERLQAVDLAIVGLAAAEGCRFCGGPLHRGDHARKPRGAAIAIAGEAFTRRFSLCCGRGGCRKRAMPPSVRFLGRRVYLGAVVVIASAVALAAAAASEIRRATGVSARTTRRWLGWWRGSFVATHVFVDLCARLVPPPSRQHLPTSILERLAGEAASRIAKLGAWLAPITTTSLPDGSRFVRAAV
jgi:hypothetical protein